MKTNKLQTSISVVWLRDRIFFTLLTSVLAVFILPQAVNASGHSGCPDPTATCSVADTTVQSDELVDYDGGIEERESCTVERQRWDYGNGETSTYMDDPGMLYDPGTYTAELTIETRYGITDSVTCPTVTVNPTPPTASCSWEPNDPKAGETLIADGSNSEDYDDLDGRWEFEDNWLESYEFTITRPDGSTFTVSDSCSFGGSNCLDPIRARVTASEGTYQADLTVTDNKGLSDTTSCGSITVDPSNNSAPTASCDWSPNNPTVGDTITYDGSASSDPDGSISSYDWTITRPNGTSFSPTFYWWQTNDSGDITNSNQGTYTADLTVTDNDGAEDSTQCSVSVGSANQPPNAKDNATTTPSKPIDIDVLDNDTDPDGNNLTIDSVQQATDNGGTATIKDADAGTIRYNPSKTGQDTFTYTAADGNGGTDQATVTVDVQASLQTQGSITVKFVDQNGNTVSGGSFQPEYNGSKLSSQSGNHTYNVTVTKTSRLAQIKQSWVTLPSGYEFDTNDWIDKSIANNYNTNPAADGFPNTDRKSKLGIAKKGTSPPVSGTSPSVSLSADPNTIEQGESSTLEWDVSNADSCQWQQRLSGSAASGDGTHSTDVSPNNNTTYKIKCSQNDGDSDTSEASVNIKTNSIDVAISDNYCVTADTEHKFDGGASIIQNDNLSESDLGLNYGVNKDEIVVYLKENSTNGESSALMMTGEEHPDDDAARQSTAGMSLSSCSWVTENFADEPPRIEDERDEDYNFFEVGSDGWPLEISCDTQSGDPISERVERPRGGFTDTIEGSQGSLSFHSKKTNQPISGYRDEISESDLRTFQYTVEVYPDGKRNSDNPTYKDTAKVEIIASSKKLKLQQKIGSDSIQTADVYFRTGTEMYALAADDLFDDKKIKKYSLSSNGDITSRSQVAVGPKAGGYLEFSSDGKKMYARKNGKLTAWTLSTAWDVTSASKTNQVDIGHTSVTFTSDGTKLYGSSGGSVVEYNLSTAWDISTATQTASEDLTSDPIKGMDLTSGGSELILGTSDLSERIHKFNLSTPADITTATKVGSVVAGPAKPTPYRDTFAYGGNGLSGCTFVPSGMYVDGSTIYTGGTLRKMQLDL